MSRLRVLYVEDNEDLREVVPLMLECEHREIVACKDAEQALATFEAAAFDILITDVGLPGLSGADLARRVLAWKPRCWIVFCSGYVVGPELMRLGPNVRALPKPFDFDDLGALISEIDCSVRHETG